MMWGMTGASLDHLVSRTASMFMVRQSRGAWVAIFFIGRGVDNCWRSPCPGASRRRPDPRRYIGLETAMMGNRGR